MGEEGRTSDRKGASEDQAAVSSRVPLAASAEPPELSASAEPPEPPEGLAKVPATPQAARARTPQGIEKHFPVGSKKRRIAIALGLYALTVIVFAVVAGDRMLSHTPFNHYAHLADAWLHGRQDIVHGGPTYAQGNDFAEFEGKTYVSFPPFPAALMLPLVKLAGSPEDFRDGQFIVWLSGLAPAFLFFALEKLRRSGRTTRSEQDNVLFALAFAFGTVYFFTSVQGTVWFAAHVVGAGLVAAYLWVAIDAERPVIAGALLGCAFLTRPSTAYLALFFGLETLRVTCKEFATEGPLLRRIERTLAQVDRKQFAERMVPFVIPILVALGLASLSNYTRFHTFSPTAFGHEHLTVQWHGRIEKWGLFGFHYLSKNLGCFLTILPWPRARGADPLEPLFRINEHGLALWFTTPLYLWLLWPKKKGFLHNALLVSAALPMLQNLLYQNSGWQQFGYRFSNDYSPFLFALLAVGGRPLGPLWKVAAAWSIAWNSFGAVSFQRANFERYYFREGSQSVLYQPD